MKIFLAVAKLPDVDGPWIVDALDEYTEDAGGMSLEEMLVKAKEKNAKAEVRIAVVEVSDTFLDHVFETYSETAKREGVTK